MFAFDISTRFAGSSLLFRSLSLDDALKSLAQTDLTYVDLWATPGVLEHVDPARDIPADVQARVEDHNLRPSSISAYATFGNDLVARLEFAAAIGAPLVIGTAPVREYERREAADDVRALGRAAQDLGVTLALANQVGTWLDEPSEIASFLDDVGHPRVQLSLTPPHARLASTTLRAVADAADGRVGHTCLWSVSPAMQDADNLGPAEDQAPGHGTVDFRALTSMLDERNYFGMFTFIWGSTENVPAEQTVAAIAAARAHVLDVSTPS
ncbi:MAG: sugar phosphate isomerase/epimerase [Chloroflexi bacterium]|nr:sugar phosphate isomerase/epimerase [Chloroflexota bacterium]